jgi:REDY-like protein HapK
MTTVVVLFNLKPGVDARRYEAWARSTDLPIVNDLASVRRFEVLKASGLLSGNGEAPYAYVEILELESLDGLRADVASERIQQVASEFREFAQDPVFMVTAPI